jgi:K+-transporting ATPase ATPase C chain
MLVRLRQALVVFVWLTLVTGIAYPAAVTAVSRLLFPDQASGSLVRSQDGVVLGSALVGQSFTDDGHFWGRPSATSPKPYDATSSGGSNLAPTNPALREAVAARLATWKNACPTCTDHPPVDLVTASASGLDPHVSPMAARAQIPRVARARALPEGEVAALVERHVQGRTLGLFGEPRVNVLELNLDLERLGRERH